MPHLKRVIEIYIIGNSVPKVVSNEFTDNNDE